MDLWNINTTKCPEDTKRNTALQPITYNYHRKKKLEKRGVVDNKESIELDDHVKVLQRDQDTTNFKII